MDQPPTKKSCKSWSYFSDIGNNKGDNSPKKRIKLEQNMEKQNSPNGPLSHIPGNLDDFDDFDRHVLGILDVPANCVQSVMTSTKFEIDYCKQVKQMEQDRDKDRERVVRVMTELRVEYSHQLPGLEIVKHAKMQYGRLTDRELVDLIQLYKKHKDMDLRLGVKNMIQTCIRRPPRPTTLRHPYIL